MVGRWSCIVLVFAFAACRTPQKNVSVYPLTDNESGSTRRLDTGSNVGRTETNQVNLPNFTATVTVTNPPDATTPVTGSSQPAKSEPSVADELPEKSAAQQETVHWQPGGLTAPVVQTNAVAGFGNLNDGHTLAPAPRQFSASVNLQVKPAGNSSITPTKNTIHMKPGELPVAQTNATATLDVPSRHSAQNVATVNRPIHLNWSAWTNSATREVGGLVNLNASHAPVVAPQRLSTSVNMPVVVDGNSSSAPVFIRAVTLPEVGTAALSAEGAIAQPVALETLLDGAHDEAWRKRQVDRQRAAESARQSERDSLEKTLQQFLQPISK